MYRIYCNGEYVGYAESLDEYDKIVEDEISDSDNNYDENDFERRWY